MSDGLSGGRRWSDALAHRLAIGPGDVAVIAPLFDLYERPVPIALQRLQPQREVVVPKPRDALVTRFMGPKLTLDLGSLLKGGTFFEPKKVPLELPTERLKLLLQYFDRVGGHLALFPQSVRLFESTPCFPWRQSPLS